MVDRIFGLFRKEWTHLTDAALLLAIFALLSQLLALVRDRIFAHTFGASHVLDMYYAAFRIPDLLFATIASFVSAAVIIPLFVERSEHSTEDARAFLGRILAAFLFVAGCIAAVVSVAMPFLADRFFPEFVGVSQGVFIELSRIMLLSPILLGVSSILGSVAQSNKKFFVYALSPVVYNVGIILGVLLFYPFWGMRGLALGVVLGAFFHMVVNIPALSAVAPRLVLKGAFDDIKSVITLSLPRTVGLSLGQITLFALVVWAAMLPEGSVAIFNFALNLQSVPLAIIGVSFSVAAFPTLARLYSEKNMAAFLDHVLGAARQIIFWSLPATALFVVLRAQIVRVILGSGSFDWTDTKLTAATLALFTLSLAAQGLILLFVRGYYAAGNTKTPLIANVAGALGTMVFAVMLLGEFTHVAGFKTAVEHFLRVDGLPGTNVLMLSLAYTIGSILNAVILMRLFARDFDTKGALRRTAIESAGAALAIGTVGYLSLNVLSYFFALTTFLGIFLQGLFAGIAGIAAGIAFLRTIKNREYEEISRSLHARFWKGSIVVPDTQEL